VELSIKIKIKIRGQSAAKGNQAGQRNYICDKHYPAVQCLQIAKAG
jgi:hypothetical protein